MADVVLSRKEIQLIIEGRQLEDRYISYIDSAFMPISLAIDVIEKGKKGVKMPSELKKLFSYLPECVSVIPLSPHGLYKAMCNSVFSEKYVNRAGNPFEFATEASLYEFEGWGERIELLDSLMLILWE